MVMGEMTEAGIISTVESARAEETAPGGGRGGGRCGAGARRRCAGVPPAFLPGGTRFLNTYAHNVAYEHIYLTGPTRPGWE